MVKQPGGDAEARRGIVNYLRRVLDGETAANFNFPRLADFTGSAYERQHFSGFFAFAILHYRKDPAPHAAPTTTENIDPKLWVTGWQIVRDFYSHRGNLDSSVIQPVEILQNPPVDEMCITIGHLLVGGLQEQNLPAEYIARDAVAAMEYALGQRKPDNS